MKKVITGKHTPNETIACNKCSIDQNMKEHNSYKEISSCTS